jgi:hypothetical protein
MGKKKSLKRFITALTGFSMVFTNFIGSWSGSLQLPHKVILRLSKQLRN